MGCVNKTSNRPSSSIDGYTDEVCSGEEISWLLSVTKDASRHFKVNSLSFSSRPNFNEIFNCCCHNKTQKCKKFETSKNQKTSSTVYLFSQIYFWQLYFWGMYCCVVINRGRLADWFQCMFWATNSLRCQFHQHFTRTFFVRKSFEQLFCR